MNKEISEPTVSPVTSADFTPEELDSSTYDVAKYISPFWKGNIVYNECVFPIKDKNGDFRPFRLMYKASEIVSVKNYTLTETYTEGVDYVLDDGKLRLLPGTSVKVIDHSYMHPTENPDNRPVEEYYPRADGSGFEYWSEENELSEAQICVTYIHNDVWSAPVPPSLRPKFPKTVAKLEKGESLKIVAIGDSVTCGAKSSAQCEIPPYADSYIYMAQKALAMKFANDNITLVNSAVGGSISDCSDEKLREFALDHSPDFLTVAFGMNDSSFDRVGTSDEQFRSNINSIIERVRAEFPECEIMLIASLYGNPYTFQPPKYESHAAVLHELAEKWDRVGVCDPQMIEKALLEKKDFLDIMSDNMVHPNDFGMRLIAQSVVHSLCDEA